MPSSVTPRSSTTPTMLLALLAMVPLFSADLSAQDAPPAGFAAAELDRSRSCVPVIADIEELDQRLAPLAAGTQRLLAVARAVALEDRTVVDSLDVSDATERAVRDWFLADAELAQRYVDEGDEAIVQQRAAGRDAVKKTVNGALASVQARADSTIAESGDLPARSTACDGAILIRSAVLEVCDTTASPVCAAAADSTPGGRFRFVDSPERLWDVEELRPWTPPGPLVRAPDGSLQGARTTGGARNGNILLEVTLAPLLQRRTELTPDQLNRLETINDSLGIESAHPDVVFAPSLSLRASLPEPLAGESFYVLHFDTPENADVVWTGPAGTGEPIQAVVAMGSSHLARLRAGDPLWFTAVREPAEGSTPEGENPDSASDGDAVFSIRFTNINQAPATTALLQYMTSGLADDLTRLVPPTGS